MTPKPLDIEQRILEEFKEIITNVKNLESENVWTDSERKQWFLSALKEVREDEKRKVIGEMKEPLEIVLDFVERWNKKDLELETAESASELREKLK